MLIYDSERYGDILLLITLARYALRARVTPREARYVVLLRYAASLNNVYALRRY